MRKKLHQICRRIPHIVLVGQHDHRVRANKTALISKRSAKIKRDITFAGWQNAARCPAGQISLELMAIGHATTKRDQLPDAGPSRRDNHPGGGHTTRH